MRFVKKTSIFLILLILCLSLSIPAYAASDLSSNGKAEVLNKLSILQGGGNGYDLDSQLTRAQAMAFIVRMMGKEAYVLANKSTYGVTKFPDVKANEWYAPYIGYCADQKIVSGYLSGNFGPNDNISEKAFLKMVLGLLGYREGVDFKYDIDLYEAAYNVGLVADSSYLTKEADNAIYMREDVVNVLYNTLTLEDKVTEARVIENLIAAGIVSRSVAESTGIIGDSVATSIEKITAVRTDQLVITFNEAVQNVEASAIEVYERNNPGRELLVEVTDKNYNSIYLKTSTQAPDVEYVVNISAVRDSAGNITGSLTGSFLGYRPDLVKSDLFKVSKVESVSKNIINVYFTHPINVNSENPGFYSLTKEDGTSFVVGNTQTLTVKSLSNTDNGVSLYLKEGTLTADTMYRLKVSGELTSLYRVRLGEGLGDSVRFKGSSSDLEKISIVKAEALTDKVLRVEFNMAVDPNFAGKFVNYTLTSPTGEDMIVDKVVFTGTGDKKGKAVLLYIQKQLDMAKLYVLTIDTLMDAYRQTMAEAVKAEISGKYPEKVKMVVTNVTEIDAGTLALTLDRALDPETAVQAWNYQVVGVKTGYTYNATPVKVFYGYEKNPNVVKLFLPADKPLVPYETYLVRVFPAVKDYMGIQPPGYVETVFTATASATTKPVISKAVLIAKDTVKVEFNKEIVKDVVNIFEDNYTLEYSDGGSVLKKAPLSVSYIDGTTLILKFDSLDTATEYTLRFNSLTDYTGSNTRTAKDGGNTAVVTVGN